MARERLLVDTNFLYAAYDEADKFHEKAIQELENNPILLIPEVILVEVTYLLTLRVGIPKTLDFLDSLFETKLPLISLTSDDLKRARDIMATYADNQFDFVDCCIMALSERLNVTKIYTFDRRDFSVFRPRHCDYLELLP
ncbi:MAG: PIN domain-containing protein [Anaerolineaceae bacterium]|nr:PIN domain-containing protein [Anaerolineaceae bacterium]